MSDAAAQNAVEGQPASTTEPAPTGANQTVMPSVSNDAAKAAFDNINANGKPAEQQVAEADKPQELPNAPAEQVAEEAKQNVPEAAGEWPVTDSQLFNASVQMMQESGMAPGDTDAIFGEYAKTGDASKIDMEALGARIGADKAALVATGVKDFYTTQGRANLAKVAAAHEVAGGEDNWNTVRDYARNKAATDPAFAKEYERFAGMINQGEVEARMVTQHLVNTYNADPKNTTLGAGTATVRGDTKDVSATFEPFKGGIAEYADAVEAAKGDSKKIDQLNQRWLATKKG